MTITPRTPKRTVPRQSKTTAGGPRNAETSFETGPHLLSYECGDDTTAISHGLLHLANFPRFHGRIVGWPDGSADSGRLLFEGGGFALTHTARVERTSGTSFTTAELGDLTDAFTFFCWLCTEARCGPMLLFPEPHRAVVSEVAARLPANAAAGGR